MEGEYKFPMIYRTEYVRVRLTPAEKAQLDRAVAIAGLSVSDFTRARLLGSQAVRAAAVYEPAFDGIDADPRPPDP
jgi:uncharacterized protein (DUF1778 family)